MQRLNTDRKEVPEELKHKPIKGFGNTAPRNQAQIAANVEALECVEIERNIVCDEDFESLTDVEINRLVADKLGIDSNVIFDPCNVYEEADLIIENFNCTMDVDGTCYAHNYNIRIKCPDQILRATMIAYLIESNY